MGGVAEKREAVASNLETLDPQGAAAYLEAADELVPFYERFRALRMSDGSRRVLVTGPLACHVGQEEADVQVRIAMRNEIR